MIVQGAFNLLFRPGLRKDFRDTFQNFDPEYPMFLKVGTTSTPEQSATIMAGLNRLYERGDGEAITYDVPKMGPKVMGVDKEFGSGYIVSRKTVEDDQYGKANQASKWLAEAARLTMEYRSAALLDDAFTGTDFKGIDSLPLCHTAHTLINSSATVANRPATEVGLSVTGITALLDLFMVMKNENGDPIRMFPDTLLIGNNSGDYHRALQIFNSQLEPFTAENQENAIRMRLPKPRIILSHYKASAKSYFMIDSKWNDAWFLTRRPVAFDDTFDFDTDAMKAKASCRFMIWFVDWRGWCGANPL
jgi:hypothetical protein